MPPNIFLCTLAQSLAAGGSETEIFLSRITTLTGETVTTSQFSTFGRGIITIDPTSSTNIEFCSFTGVSSSNISFTGATRGLSALSNSTVSANKKYHPVGTQVIISFGVHNIQDLKKYIDDTFSGSIGNASSTVSGITRLSINPASPTVPIAAGANNTLSGTAISGSNDVVDESSLATTSTNNAVVRANSSGKIDASFLTAVSIPTTQIFTSSGTWTKPAGTKWIRVRLVGSGAGGGNAGPTGSVVVGGGGGPGGYSEKIIDVSSITTETVTVGVGGGPQANGATTSFGALLQATGGTAGGANGAPGSGGSGSGGDLNINNGAGSIGSIDRSSGPTTRGYGGHGGSTPFGEGAYGAFEDGPGATATAPGTGGGGAASTNASGTNSGGSGADGIVVVNEFYS